MKKLRKSLTRRLSSGLSSLSSLSMTKNTSKIPTLAKCYICGLKNYDGRHRSCVECGITLCYSCTSKGKKFEKIEKGQYTCGDRRHARRKKERDFAMGFKGDEFEIDPTWSVRLDWPLRLPDSPYQCPKHPFYRILKQSFTPVKIRQIAQFQGLSHAQSRVRRTSKMQRFQSAISHPAREYLDWSDISVDHRRTGSPMGAGLKDEWSITEITFGQSVKNLDVLLTFCFQHCITHEAMRVTVRSVMNFVGVIEHTTFCVIAFDCSKQYRVSSSCSTGGWWGRIMIADVTGSTLSERKNTTCPSPTNTTYSSEYLSPQSPATISRIRRSDSPLSPRSRLQSTSDELYFEADELLELHMNGSDHVSDIHSKWLVQITRSASKNWGTHYVAVNHSELSAFLKRTRIANLLLSSSDEKIETVCKNEDTLKIFADYLCRTIAHMCDSFHNVSKSRQTNSTRRVGSSTIPVPRNFLSWYSDFHKQIMLGCEPETGCIEGNCEVLMADGSFRRARDIVPGDRVCTSCQDNPRYNTVVCTIHQTLNPSVTSMCVLSEECILTPEHPIRMSSQSDWILPNSLVRAKPCHVSVLCNFVLALHDDGDIEGGHAVVVGDFECITLGHCCSDAFHKIWSGMGIRRYLQAQNDYPRVCWYGRMSGERLKQLERDVVALND